MQKNGLKKWLWISFLPLFIIACATTVPISIGQVQATQAPQVQQQITIPTPTSFQVPPAVLDEQAVLISLYAQVNPGVVNIMDYTSQSGQDVPSGQGSGFVYDQEGHIVTNAHVVIDAKELDVTFSDGTVLPAEIVGQDPNADLAVIKVDNLPAGANPLKLGSMEDISVGQTVVAIGNPFGLEGTLTRGIVSALGRTIPALTSFSIPQAIQTDAAINPGNSGGPLLNLQGEVIGVNAQIETGSSLSSSNSGVGFAVPVSLIKLVVPELIKNGKYEWAWLGVQGGDLDPTTAKANNLSFDKGAYIAKVMSGGPAQKAGIKGSTGEKNVDGRTAEVGGDVITAIDGKSVQSFDDLLIYIALEAKPGQEVTLTIYRAGKMETVKVLLEVRPDTVQ
jgi:S1-C subfamily serine protease